MLSAGIDIGSRTTKTVLVENGEILSKYLLPTGWDPLAAAEQCFAEALCAKNIHRSDVQKITATGYGRILVPFADETKTEITCHARGAYVTDNSVRTVIDIGGQDSKIIRVDENGLVEDFAMNDRCAAGTGKFLEFLAHSLNTSVELFAGLSLESQNPSSISSMCTVFAESEVLSLVAEKVPVCNIVAGIHRSIAKRMISLIHTTGYAETVFFSGGVARNTGLLNILQELLNVQISVPEFPEYTGALGAALLV